jgi:hypothetical protein
MEVEGESFSAPRSTQASNTGKFAHIFGPRRARTFRNSMNPNLPDGIGIAAMWMLCRPEGAIIVG